MTPHCIESTIEITVGSYKFRIWRNEVTFKVWQTNSDIVACVSTFLGVFSAAEIANGVIDKIQALRLLDKLCNLPTINAVQVIHFPTGEGMMVYTVP